MTSIERPDNLVRIDELTDHDQPPEDWGSGLVLPGETSVREALARMQQAGCDCIGVDTGAGPVAMLSKEDLLYGLLRELDAAERVLCSLQSQVEGGLSDQMELVQESVRTLMQTARSKLDLAVHQLAEGLILLDRHGRVESSNPAGRQLLGLEDEAPETVLDVALERIGVSERIEQAGGMQTQQPGRLEHTTDDGRVLELRWRAMADEWGHFLGHVVVIRDISEQIAADRAKSEFIAAVSHELCTPLTGLQSGLSNLLAGVAGRVRRRTRQYLEAMNGDCVRLSGLVHDLVDMAKLQAGSMPLHRCVMDVGPLVAEAADHAREAAAEKGLKIQVAIEAQIQTAYVDPERIRQVLDKLTGNAIRFTRPGGQMMIRAQRRGEHVVLEVEDTGIGISATQKERIFGTFYQVDRPVGPGCQGSGLGLAICSGIVHAHGGTIDVQSHRGRGSRFVVSLPSSEPYVVLGEHIEKLIRPGSVAAGAFALARVRLEVQSGASEELIGPVRRMMTQWVTHNRAILTNPGDMLVQEETLQTALVIAKGRSGRIEDVWHRMRKGLFDEIEKNKWNSGQIVPMVGVGFYPAEADDPAELERVVRRRMERLTRPGLS